MKKPLHFIDIYILVFEKRYLEKLFLYNDDLLNQCMELSITRTVPNWQYLWIKIRKLS